MLGTGIAIGLLLTTAAQRFISAVVAIEIQKDGPLMPARRAASVEPMVALRDE